MNNQQQNIENRILHNRIVLINGSSNLLGNSILIELAKSGAHLVLLDRNTKALQRITKDIQAHFKGEVYGFSFELTRTDPRAYSKLENKIRKKVPHLDAVILTNHWSGYEINLISYPFSLWQQIIQVNLSSNFMLSQVLMPLLLKAKKPKLLFNIYNNTELEAHSAYTVAQNSLENLMKTCAKEFNRSHLTVFAVQPMTNSPSSLTKQGLQQIARLYPNLLTQKRSQLHGQTINLRQWSESLYLSTES